MKAFVCPGINVTDNGIVNEVCEFLSRYNIDSIINNLNYLPDEFYINLDKCDILIPIGGDGTIIHYAKHAAPADKPVLGINAGRLGYMAALERSELDMLSKLNTGNYKVQDRMMLNLKTANSNTAIFNDVVISKGMSAHTIDLDIYCNGALVNSTRGDGIIVATPTGSTAYTLSAGGPVVDPELNSILVTPICPHSFFSRTMIFSDDKTITIAVKSHEACLSPDGERNMTLAFGDVITVEKGDYSAKFIDLNNTPFHEIINHKFKCF